jgi:hypothetical protein
VKSTGLIKRIDVTKWKHSQAKETLEVSFTVEGTKADLSPVDLAGERSLDELPLLVNAVPYVPDDYMSPPDGQCGGEATQEVTPWDVSAGEGGIDYAKDFLTEWVTANQGRYYMMNMAGKDADYDLLGYDIRELLRTTEWKKYQKIMWGDDWEKKQSLLSINELDKTPKNNS